MPLLSALVRAAGLPHIASGGDPEIIGITSDSREVKPGMLFVPVQGVKIDGAKFIPEAKQKGGIIFESPNTRLALAKLAAAFYAPQPRHMVAVTGTDGKTSTADFFRQFAADVGRKAASIGTLGTLGEGRKELAPGLNTTPGPIALHQMLQTLAQDAYTHVALEASSHGLDQYRLDGVKLDAAAFTNLTRDHLDYHGTPEAYFAAKSRLFSELLPQSAPAILNADDARFAELSRLHKRILTYGRNGNDLKIVSTAPTPEGQNVSLSLFGKPYQFALPHVGAFQVYNILAALALAVATGEDAAKLAALIPTLEGVPGRLERVGLHKGAAVYIDYAHTPAALANVLSTLRPHTQGRLIVVFGCGGDRDKGKRPEMGRAAAELADIAIVTDDNPRSEDPAAIRAEVLSGAPGAKAIADRKQALYGAIAMLKAGDVLLAAGKGHEKTQIIGSEVLPFDDAEILRGAMSES